MIKVLATIQSWFRKALVLIITHALAIGFGIYLGLRARAILLHWVSHLPKLF